MEEEKKSAGEGKPLPSLLKARVDCFDQRAVFPFEINATSSRSLILQGSIAKDGRSQSKREGRLLEMIALVVPLYGRQNLAPARAESWLCDKAGSWLQLPGCRVQQEETRFQTGEAPAGVVVREDTRILGTRA